VVSDDAKLDDSESVSDAIVTVTMIDAADTDSEILLTGMPVKFEIPCLKLSRAD